MQKNSIIEILHQSDGFIAITFSESVESKEEGGEIATLTDVAIYSSFKTEIAENLIIELSSKILAKRGFPPINNEFLIIKTEK